MVKVQRNKPREDLIPRSIGAAWQRASHVRFRQAPPTDLRMVFDWIVSVMTPAARGKLMSNLVAQGALAASARQERRKGVRASARPGRRKGLQTSARRQRRNSVRAPARSARQKGVRAQAKQERRRGKRAS
jgi:hypothetical protein